LLDKKIKRIRKIFENRLLREGYSYENLEQDEYGYILWDVELLWGGFIAGYITAKEEYG